MHNTYIVKCIRNVLASGKIKCKNNTTLNITNNIQQLLITVSNTIEEITKRLANAPNPIRNMNLYNAFVHAFCAIPIISEEGYLLDSCKYPFIKPDPRLDINAIDLSPLHKYVNSIISQRGGGNTTKFVYDFSKNEEDFTNLDLTPDPEGEDAHLYRYSEPSYIKNEIFTQLTSKFPEKSKDELAYLTDDITQGYGRLLGYVGMPSYDYELIAKAIEWHQTDRFSKITHTEFETIYFDRKQAVNHTRFQQWRISIIMYLMVSKPN